MSLVLFEFSFVVIDAYQDWLFCLKEKLWWFSCGKVRLWCGLIIVQGAIDGTHIYVLKPKGEYAKDYYYHKTSGISNWGLQQNVH
jgi:hypothetical protein